MDVVCRCGHEQWIGLVHCTHCGVEMTAIPPWQLDRSEMTVLHDGPSQHTGRHGGRYRLYGAFGDLVIAPERGPVRIIQIEGGREAVQSLPGDLDPLDLEIVGVGRWLVVRSGQRVQALAAPLLRTGYCESSFQLIGEGATFAPPARLLDRALPNFGGSGAASIARLGSLLVQITGEEPGRSTIRALDLGRAHNGSSHAVKMFERSLEGEWLLDRGGAPGSDFLVLHSEFHVGFLSFDRVSGEIRLRTSSEAVPHPVLPTSTVLTRSELVFLATDRLATDTQNRNRVPYSWEFDSPRPGAPARVGLPGGRPIDGIEPSFIGGRVGVVARSGTSFFAYQADGLSFSGSPQHGLQINTEAPSTAGAVVYWNDRDQRLHARFVDDDLPLPPVERLDGQVAAVEGPRVWLVGRREGQPWIRLFERRQRG